MKTIFTIALLFIFQLSVNCQQIPEKFSIYKVKLQCFEKEKSIKGVFYDFNDSTIILIDTKSKDDIINYRVQFKKIPTSTINSMKVRRNGKVGTYAILGGLAGATTGIILGLAEGDDEPPCGWWSDGGCMTAGDKAALYGIPLFIVGGIIGAIAGIPNKNFEIQGKTENIIKNRKKFEKYSIIKNHQ